MSSINTVIFDGILTNQVHFTDTFIGQSFAWLEWPEQPPWSFGEGDFLEVDAFILIATPDGGQREAGEVIQLSSRDVYTIPDQYRDQDFPMQFALIGDENNREVIVHTVATSCTNVELCERADDMQQSLDEIETINALTATLQLGQAAAQIATATTLGSVLAPVTAGASLALPSGAIAAIGPAAAPVVEFLATGLLVGTP